jgi:urease accessory protein
MSDWLAWQLVDSAFPTGGFVHSFGLEAAWQHGEVAGSDGLRRFVKASILQAGHGVLPLMNDAYHRPAAIGALDRLADAFLVNVVANRASRVQGRTLVATVGRVWPSSDLEDLRRDAIVFSHVAPVSGVTFRLLGVPLPTAQRLALYGVARGVLTAAVRLGIVGSYESQRLQHDAAPWMEHVAKQCAALGAADLAQVSPVIDVLQGCHDRLYSRLFQS